MNLDTVKEIIKKNLNRQVEIVQYGHRNRNKRYNGILYKVYPNLFSIIEDEKEKSFSYNDLISGDIRIKYK